MCRQVQITLLGAYSNDMGLAEKIKKSKTRWMNDMKEKAETYALKERGAGVTERNEVRVKSSGAKSET